MICKNTDHAKELIQVGIEPLANKQIFVWQLIKI